MSIFNVDVYFVIFVTSVLHYPPYSAGIRPIMNLLTVGCSVCRGDNSVYLMLLGCQ